MACFLLRKFQLFFFRKKHKSYFVLHKAEKTGKRQNIYMINFKIIFLSLYSL